MLAKIRKIWCDILLCVKLHAYQCKFCEEEHDEWVCEWKAGQLDAKGLQTREFPRADTHCRLLEVNSTGSSRTREHCLISEMNADIIIVYR